MSCIKSLPELCRLGIARVGIRTLLLVLFTYVTQHTAVLLGNSSTLNKRGENPPRCNRTTPAVFSLANPSVNAQTIFSFSAVMAFHEALKSKYPRIHTFLAGRAKGKIAPRPPVATSHKRRRDKVASGSNFPQQLWQAVATTPAIHNDTSVYGQLGEILGGVRVP